MAERNAAGRVGLVAGKKEKLGSLVAYQSGSVVSRTIINRKTGTVTLFAFDAGDGLSEHTSPYDALLYIIEGEALVTVAGEANKMEAGDAVILPAGKPHAVRAVKRFKMLLTMIRLKQLTIRVGFYRRRVDYDSWQSSIQIPSGSATYNSVSFVSPGPITGLAPLAISRL